MKVSNATGPDAPNLPALEDPNQPPGVPPKPKPIDPPQEVPPVKLPPEPAAQPLGDCKCQEEISRAT